MEAAKLENEKTKTLEVEITFFASTDFLRMVLLIFKEMVIKKRVLGASGSNITIREEEGYFIIIWFPGRANGMNRKTFRKFKELK